MSSAIENTKILVVDTSPAMLEVLRNFAGKHGYDLDSHCDPLDAIHLIERRTEQFERDFRCVMLGWPQGDPAIIQDLIGRLSTPDHLDLPLLIICQEVTAEIASLTKRRPRTTALLWKEYQQAAELIDRLPVAKAPVKTADPVITESQDTSENDLAMGLSSRVLLVDQTPSMCHTLKDLLVSHGYEVTVAETAVSATELLDQVEFDLVLTDYHLHENNGTSTLDTFCAAVDAHREKSVVVVVSAKYTDRIIKHSLASGAVSCLFKNESTELLYARIHALVKTVHGKAAKADKEGRAIAQIPHPTEVKPQVQVRDALVAEPVKPLEETESPAENEPDAAAETASVEIREPLSREEFSTVLEEALELVAENQHGGIRYSILMLDVQIEAATGDRLSLGDSTPMCGIVEEALGRLYKRPRSLVYLGNGQFALLLANQRLQDALMLTRKVLQVVPRMIRYLNDMSLVSHAAVVQLDGKTVGADEVLQQCRDAVARARRDRRDNCALVMPLKKYLTALESEEAVH